MTLTIATFLLSLALMPATQTQASATQQAPATKPAPIPAPINEELWAAARAGDTAKVAAALDKGADVNAKTRYGATALTFAADKGHLEVVKLLIARGADVNAQDTFYQMRAVDMAMMNNQAAVVTLLLERGSKGAPGVLQQAIQRGDVALVTVALASPELTLAHLRPALAGAKKVNNPEIVALIEKKLAAMPVEPAAPAVSVDRATLQSYVGSYRNEEAGAALTVVLNGEQLMATPPGGTAPTLTLVATSPTSFRVAEREGLTISFEGRGGLDRARRGHDREYAAGLDARRHATGRCASAAGRHGHTAARGAGSHAGRHQARRSHRRPQLARLPRRQRRRQRRRAGRRGRVGRRHAAEHPLEDRDSRHLQRQPGRVGQPRVRRDGRQQRRRHDLQNGALRRRRAGERPVRAHLEDLLPRQGDGKIIWERDAYKGAPKVKRHTKASQANSTPVTDGRRVVAIFGSIGMLAAWDMDGKPLWTTDVGIIDSGWFFEPDTQWGHSSSPIIHGESVIVQADRQKDSFIAAYHAATGKEQWRTARDEISTLGNADGLPRR